MLTNTRSILPVRSSFRKQCVRPASLALASLLLLAGCATGSPPGSLLFGFSLHSRPSSLRQGSGSQPSAAPSSHPDAVGGSGGFSAQVAGSVLGDIPGEANSCSGQALPSGWPDFSSNDAQALLAPFLSCPSPADFLALQQRVDMPRLVARLDDWSAVRLGALGPVREDAASTLNRKRASFLLQSVERYGAANTQILAHFVLDSSHDDDLRDILLLLARDKRLQELLELLPSLGSSLEVRGLKPSAYAERAFRWSDLGRGLVRAGRDALSTSPLVEGAQSRLMEFSVIRAQLPTPYQQALDAVEREQLERQFSPGHVVVATVDHMTFGVPLGFYGLVAGTGHGAYTLIQGRYEQAVRELAPAALLVALYAGGKGARALSGTQGLSSVGSRGLGGLEGMESRVRGLQEMARQLEAILGVDGLRELAWDIRASREAGRFVAVGGVDAALALRETWGNVAQAQAMMSKARPEATGSSVVKGGAAAGSEPGTPVTGEAVRSPQQQVRAMACPGGGASLVDEQAGLTLQVVEARLTLVEREATGPRLPADVKVLEREHPSLDSPPPGAEGSPRWSEYVAYREKRLGELQKGMAVEGPLRWEAYERMWGWFTRGVVFERFIVQLLRADANLPRVQRRFLSDFDQPRVEAYVGVRKPKSGLRFVDILIIEEGPPSGRFRRVETISCKSRDLSGLKYEALEAQMVEDAREASLKYGEKLDIRRESLHPLLIQSSEVPIAKVLLIYEGGALMPKNVAELRKAVRITERTVEGVEVLFQ